MLYLSILLTHSVMRQNPGQVTAVHSIENKRYLMKPVNIKG